MFTQNFIPGLTLSVSEIYTETGLIILTGEQLWVYSSTSNGVTCNVFGEEVDAS